VAVTPILDRVGRPSVVFATGTPAGVSRVGGIVVLAFSSQHRHTLLECAFTDWPFGYCLVVWGGQAAYEGRFGIRSVPTDSYFVVVRSVT